MEKTSSVLCQHCRKQEATVHFTRVISRVHRTGGAAPAPGPGSTVLPTRPGDIKHTDLCEPCAIALGAIPPI
jgi:hypothetical protein